MSIKCRIQNNTFIKTVLTGFYLVVCSFSFSQTIIENAIVDENPSLANPFTAGQTVNEYLTFSGIGRSDAIEGNEAQNRYNAHLWNTTELDEMRYFTFTITPGTNCYIDFLSFEYTAQKSKTGPVNVVLRSSIDDFTDDIGMPAIDGGNIDLASEDFQEVDEPIELRLYAWGASTDEGTFSVKNFVFKGYVFDRDCMVPAVPGMISGNNETYPGENGLVYQIAPIDRADDYEWNINGDAIITEGAGTDGIVVTAGENDFLISVSGTNVCGTGSMSSELHVNVEYPVLYFHNFGESEFADHPYAEMPIEIDENLQNSSWTNTNEEWLVYAGAKGNPSKAISANNLMGNPEFVLSLEVREGYQMMISGFNFWRQRSDKGPSLWSLAANSIEIGIGISPTYGKHVGRTTVLNPVSGLTGNVTIRMGLSEAASQLGTFRIDDFSLYGLVDCIPIDVDAPEDVEVCGAYELPPLNIGNYFTGPGGTGEELSAGGIITTSRIIYVYAECDTAPECNNENSFEVIIHEQIVTSPLMRVD
jgi:hypothetical protein